MTEGQFRRVQVGRSGLVVQPAMKERKIAYTSPALGRTLFCYKPDQRHRIQKSTNYKVQDKNCALG
ncbi:hypothetical protein NQ317_010013 [Molorchus minor]|uniref:Uncharacterized protein n=1 Tax=Molorchus minor TaxID=1323400 RepID=A0ABQ9J655_9CUCU|nr:hypothetical protein NQ317_010013 [Molorchus minor]